MLHLHVTHSAKNLNTLVSDEPGCLLKILKENYAKLLLSKGTGLQNGTYLGASEKHGSEKDLGLAGKINIPLGS